MRFPGATYRNIYVRSKRAGERVMEGLKRFLATKLKLKVNELKSAVARPWDRKFLSFSFTRGLAPKRRIAPKAVDRFKERVRELTSRTRGVSIERMAEDLTRYLLLTKTSVTKIFGVQTGRAIHGVSPEGLGK